MPVPRGKVHKTTFTNQIEPATIATESTIVFPHFLAIDRESPQAMNVGLHIEMPRVARMRRLSDEKLRFVDDLMSPVTVDKLSPASRPLIHRNHDKAVQRPRSP
jgi:hypothetical protein